MSALDAAAQVLGSVKPTEAPEGLAAPDLIERMRSSGLWTSPGGKTPAATLYAAIIREIAHKKDAARFVRLSPGRFALINAKRPSRQVSVAKPPRVRAGAKA